jgi:hypothetical protein
MWVVNATERRVVQSARHEVVMTAAVYLPVNVALAVLTAAMALAGGVDNLPAPVWWVALGAFGWDALRALGYAIEGYRLLRRLRSCPVCLAEASDLDEAERRWSVHPHRTARPEWDA